MKGLTLLSEFWAGIIILTQIYQIKLWVQTGDKIFLYTSGLITLVIFFFVWYAYVKRFEELDKEKVIK